MPLLSYSCPLPFLSFFFFSPLYARAYQEMLLHCGRALYGCFVHALKNKGCSVGGGQTGEEKGTKQQCAFVAIPGICVLNYVRPEFLW